MTPDGRVGTRAELELRYKSQTLWTKKRLAHRRHKAIEKLAGSSDFQWVRDHPTYVPEKPKRMRWRTYRRLRKRLMTTPRKQLELDELTSLMGQLTRATEERLGQCPLTLDCGRIPDIAALHIWARALNRFAIVARWGSS
jgi:hypothetical protein